MRATYRVVEALAGEGQIAYGVSWAVSDQHPLAAVPEPGRPVLLELTVDGTPIPWSRLRFGGAAAGRRRARAAGRDARAGRPRPRSRRARREPLRHRSAPTWHRPVPGGLGALASDADVDPAARVVVG